MKVCLLHLLSTYFFAEWDYLRPRSCDPNDVHLLMTNPVKYCYRAIMMFIKHFTNMHPTTDYKGLTPRETVPSPTAILQVAEDDPPTLAPSSTPTRPHVSHT